MTSTMEPPAALRPRAEWVRVLLPREHGGWSLALEPVALGVLAVPSVAGSLLGLATVAAFLARRPLKLVLAVGDNRGLAKVLLGMLAAVAAAGLAGAIASGGTACLAWLLAPALLGGLFLVLDLRRDGRSPLAELCGAAAFSCVAGAIAAAAGAPRAAAALLFAMAARSIPTVLFVRARVRGAKTGERHPAPPLAAATIAVFAAALLGADGAVPLVVPAALAVLWARAVVLLVLPLPGIRARTLGLLELGLGAGYVLAVGAAWPR